MMIPVPAVTEPWFRLAGTGFILCLFIAAVGLAPRTSQFLALVCYFVYFPAILPLSYLRRKSNLIPVVLTILVVAPAISLALVKVAISLVYLSAGVEKLRNAGIRWIDGQSLQAYLIENYLYNDRWQALWIARRKGLCRAISIGVLAFELTFWVVIPIPLLAWLYVPAALLFHTGTAITMRIYYWIYFLPVFAVFASPWLCRHLYIVSFRL